MAKSDRQRYVPNLLVVGVDDLLEADYAGRVWTQYRLEPFRFESAIDLIRIGEDFYDEIAFPQRATLQRSFGSAIGQNDKCGPAYGWSRPMGRTERAEKRMTNDIESNRGKKGTFIVEVKYRQNSTWQGEVTWVDEDRTVYFRSALELMELMDQALKSNAPAAKGSPAWGTDKKNEFTTEEARSDGSTAAVDHSGIQRPDAPSGSTRPEEETGSPISSAST